MCKMALILKELKWDENKKFLGLKYYQYHFENLKKIYVLKPLTKNEMEIFFSEYSVKVFQHFMNTALFSQPEVMLDKKILPLQIPKEHLEQWFVQALQVESVGAGSYPIDILKPNEWGSRYKNAFVYAT